MGARTTVLPNVECALDMTTAVWWTADGRDWRGGQEPSLKQTTPLAGTGTDAADKLVRGVLVVCDCACNELACPCASVWGGSGSEGKKQKEAERRWLRAKNKIQITRTRTRSIDECTMSLIMLRACVTLNAPPLWNFLRDFSRACQSKCFLPASARRRGRKRSAACRGRLELSDVCCCLNGGARLQRPGAAASHSVVQGVAAGAEEHTRGSLKEKSGRAHKDALI
jgi:hypothetical protein